MITSFSTDSVGDVWAFITDDGVLLFSDCYSTYEQAIQGAKDAIQNMPW